MHSKSLNQKKKDLKKHLDANTTFITFKDLNTEHQKQSQDFIDLNTKYDEQLKIFGNILELTLSLCNNTIFWHIFVTISYAVRIRETKNKLQNINQKLIETKITYAKLTLDNDAFKYFNIDYIESTYNVTISTVAAQNLLNHMRIPELDPPKITILLRNLGLKIVNIDEILKYQMTHIYSIKNNPHKCKDYIKKTFGECKEKITQKIDDMLEKNDISEAQQADIDYIKNKLLQYTKDKKSEYFESLMKKTEDLCINTLNAQFIQKDRQEYSKRLFIPTQASDNYWREILISTINNSQLTTEEKKTLFASTILEKKLASQNIKDLIIKREFFNQSKNQQLSLIQILIPRDEKSQQDQSQQINQEDDTEDYIIEVYDPLNGNITDQFY